MKTKFMFAIGILMLIAMMVPTGAIAGTNLSVDFESPTYTAGSPAAGIAGWWDWIGTGETVSSSAISGSQSLVVSNGSAPAIPVDFYGRSTISYLTKITTDSSSDVYFLRAGSPTGLAWFALSAAGGATFNVAGIAGTSADNHYDWTGAPIFVDHVYKTTIKMNFMNHKMTISMYDVADPGTVWTHSAVMAIDVTTPALGAVLGNPGLGSIGFANWGAGPVTYDDFSVSEFAFVPADPQTLPILHYDFVNTGASNNPVVKDVTGNGFDGTIAGTPDWGNSLLNFNGTQYVNTGVSEQYGLGIENDMSYVAYVKWNLVDPWIDTNYHLFGSSASDNLSGQTLRIDGDGRLTYLSWYAAGLDYQGIPGMAASNTYHIAFVRSGTTVSMYVDGVLRTDYSLGDDSVNMYDRNLESFKISNDSQPWCGQMMDVQIFNRAINGSEVATLFTDATYVPHDGPVAHYVFKDGEGTTVTDISGLGNNGTISGGAVWGTDKLTFPNQVGSVACGTEEGLEIKNDMTYTGLVKWVKVDPWVDTNYTLFSSSVDNDTGQDFRIDDSGRLTYLSWLTGSGLDYQGIPGLVAGNTYHIGFVRSGTTIKMYVNGVLRTDYNLGDSTVDMYDRNNGQFKLGNGYFCGDMMDVQIYNRALSEANLLYLFENAGKDVLGNGYVAPVLPTMNYSDGITVDGDLNDWSDATFTLLDKAYYPDPSVNLDMSNASYAFKWGAGGTKVYLALKVQDTDPVYNDWYTNWNVNDHVETQLWASGVSGTINQDICDIAQQYELGLQEDGFGTWSYMCGAGTVPDFANLNYAITQGIDGWVFYEAAMTPFTAFSRLDINAVISRALVSGDVIGADAVIASKNNWADFNMLAADTKGGKSANTSAIQKRQLVRDGISGSVELQDFGVSSLGIAGTAMITDGTNTEIHNIVLDNVGSYSFATALRGECTVIVKCSHWLGKAAIVNVDVTGNGLVALLSVTNGDVEENNEVDFSDINATRAAYGSFPGDGNWNDRADVDGTGEVDFTDINIVRSRYGEIGD